MQPGRVGGAVGVRLVHQVGDELGEQRTEAVAAGQASAQHVVQGRVHRKGQQRPGDVHAHPHDRFVVGPDVAGSGGVEEIDVVRLDGAAHLALFDAHGPAAGQHQRHVEQSRIGLPDQPGRAAVAGRVQAGGPQKGVLETQEPVVGPEVVGVGTGDLHGRDDVVHALLPAGEPIAPLKDIGPEFRFGQHAPPPFVPCGLVAYRRRALHDLSSAAARQRPSPPGPAARERVRRARTTGSPRGIPSAVRCGSGARRQR